MNRITSHTYFYPFGLFDIIRSYQVYTNIPRKVFVTGTDVYYPYKQYPYVVATTTPPQHSMSSYRNYDPRKGRVRFRQR